MDKSLFLQWFFIGTPLLLFFVGELPHIIFFVIMKR